MSNSFPTFWLLFMVVFLIFPMGVGWGYRGWGPPLPRYMQRQRAARATAASHPATFDHHAWGYGGDVMWIGMILAAFWAISFLWW